MGVPARPPELQQAAGGSEAHKAVSDSGSSAGVAEHGLTREEAAARLKQYGPNSVPEDSPSLWHRLTAQLWGPVPWMLEVAIVLQFVLHEYVEAAVIAVLLVFNALLGFAQEGRAQATLISDRTGATGPITACASRRSPSPARSSLADAPACPPSTSCMPMTGRPRSRPPISLICRDRVRRPS